MTYSLRLSLCAHAALPNIHYAEHRNLLVCTMCIVVARQTACSVWIYLSAAIRILYIRIFWRIVAFIHSYRTNSGREEESSGSSKNWKWDMHKIYERARKHTPTPDLFIETFWECERVVTHFKLVKVNSQFTLFAIRLIWMCVRIALGLNKSANRLYLHQPEWVITSQSFWILIRMSFSFCLKWWWRNNIKY